MKRFRPARLSSAVCRADAPGSQHPHGFGQADAVIIARDLLRDPYWLLRAARELDQPISWPVQYLRVASKGSLPRVEVDLKNLESCFEEQHVSNSGHPSSQRPLGRFDTRQPHRLLSRFSASRQDFGEWQRSYFRTAPVDSSPALLPPLAAHQSL